MTGSPGLVPGDGHCTSSPHGHGGASSHREVSLTGAGQQLAVAGARSCCGWTAAGELHAQRRPRWVSPRLVL